MNKILFGAVVSVALCGCTDSVTTSAKEDDMNVRCGHLAYYVSKAPKLTQKWTVISKKHLDKTKHMTEQKYYQQIGFVNGYLISQQVWTERNQPNDKALIAAENYTGSGCNNHIR